MHFLTHTVSGPSIVTSTVQCCFTSPDCRNLVVIKTSVLEIFDENLTLVFSAPIYGVVDVLLAFRLKNDIKDSIFLVTTKMHFCILSFDEIRKQLITRYSGSMEEKFRPVRNGITAQVHCSGNAICVSGYLGLLHVILVNSQSSSTSSSRMMEEVEPDATHQSKKPRKNYIKRSVVPPLHPSHRSSSSLECNIIIVDIISEAICFTLLDTPTAYDVAFIMESNDNGIYSRSLSFCSISLDGSSRRFAGLSSNIVNGKAVVDGTANMLIPVPMTSDGQAGGLMIVHRHGINYIKTRTVALTTGADSMTVDRVMVDVFKSLYIEASCEQSAFAPIDCMTTSSSSSSSSSSSVPRPAFVPSTSSGDSIHRFGLADSSSSIQIVTISLSSSSIQLDVSGSLGRLGTNAVMTLVHLHDGVMYASMAACGSSFIFSTSSSSLSVLSSSSSSLGPFRDLAVIKGNNASRSNHSLMMLTGSMYESKLSLLSFGIGLECASCLIDGRADKATVQRSWYMPANRLLFLSYVSETKVLGPSALDEATMVEIEPATLEILSRTINVFEVNNHVIHIGAGPSSAKISVYHLVNGKLVLLNQLCLPTESIVLADMCLDRYLLLYLSNKSIALISCDDVSLVTQVVVKTSELPFDDVCSWTVYNDCLFIVPWWTSGGDGANKAQLFCYSLPSLGMLHEVDLMLAMAGYYEDKKALVDQDIDQSNVESVLHQQQVRAISIQSFADDNSSFAFMFLGLGDGKIVSFQLKSNDIIITQESRLNVFMTQVFQVGAKPISLFCRISPMDLFVVCGDCSSILTCRLFDSDVPRANVEDEVMMMVDRAHVVPFCRLDDRPIVLSGSVDANIGVETISFVSALQYFDGKHIGNSFFDEDVVFVTKSGFVVTGCVRSASCFSMMRDKDLVTLSYHDTMYQMNHIRVLGGSLVPDGSDDHPTIKDVLSPARTLYCPHSQVLCVCLESAAFDDRIKMPGASSQRAGGKVKFIYFPQMHASAFSSSSYDPSDQTNGICDDKNRCIFELNLLPNEETTCIISFMLPEGFADDVVRPVEGATKCMDEYVAISTLKHGSLVCDGRVLIFRVWSVVASGPISATNLYAQCVCEYETPGIGMSIDVCVVHVKGSIDHTNRDMLLDSCFPMIVGGHMNSVVFYQLQHKPDNEDEKVESTHEVEAGQLKFVMQGIAKLDNYSMVLSVRTLEKDVDVNAADTGYSFNVVVGDAFRSTSLIKFTSELTFAIDRKTNRQAMPKCTARLVSLVPECKSSFLADFLADDISDSSVLSCDLYGNVTGYKLMKETDVEEKMSQRSVIGVSQAVVESKVGSTASSQANKLVKSASVRLNGSVNCLVCASRRENLTVDHRLKPLKLESVLSSVSDLTKTVDLKLSLFYYGTCNGSIGKIVEIPHEDFILLSALEGAMTGRGCERIGAGFVSNVGNMATHQSFRACNDNGPLNDTECLRFVDGDVLKKFFCFSPDTQRMIAAETLTRIQGMSDNLDVVRTSSSSKKEKGDALRVTASLKLSVGLLCERLERALLIH